MSYSLSFRYIMYQLADEPKSKKEMESDCLKWNKRVFACSTETDIIHFQTELISHLAEITGYQSDIEKREDVLKQLINDRKEHGLAGYRDCCHASNYSDVVAKQQTPFMDNFDDSIEAFLKCK